MGNSIYRTGQGERLLKDLYDRQAKSIGMEFEDIYVDTRFGKTHVIKIGNPEGKPLLYFHGGNSTAPYSLKKDINLLKDFLVYAPDTMGHPGKSAQTVLSPNTLEYGEWASDVITSLGFEKINCMGGSFGAGVLAKLMCVSPEKISRAVLVVPSGICNVATANIMFSMGIPMLLYILTRKEKWLVKAITPMSIKSEFIDGDTMEMVRETFENVRVKAGMPSNIKFEDIKNYNAPTLLLAGEKDVLFPGEKVIERAKRLIPNLEAHLLKDCGHMYFFSEENMKFVNSRATEFLSE